MDMEWIENQPRQVEVGDRIKLVNMPDDPHPLEAGSEGTVTSVDTRMEVIGVEWDNGRTLNLVLGVDSFNILNESLTADASTINNSMPSPTRKGKEITPTRAKMSNTFKKELKKGNVRDIKVEAEELVGGNADGMSPQDLADKHGVDLRDIQKEIEIGVEVEMEHDHSPLKAKEVAMDHIFEYPDYYSNEDHGLVASEKGLEAVHETTILEFFGAFGKKNKDDQYNLEVLGKDLKKITDTLKTATFPSRETVRTMIEKFREKYSEHSQIDTMMKSLYHEFDKIGGGDIEETTSAGSSGAFSGPLGGVQKRNESRIVKVRDLLESTTTFNSGKYDDESKSPWDENKDGWFWNDKPWFEGGEIVDDIAQLDHNWKDEVLSVKMTKEEIVNIVNLLEGSHDEYPKVISTITGAETLDQLKTAKEFAQNFVNKYSIDIKDKKFKKIQSAINLKKISLKGTSEIDETTTASSSGQYVGPMFAAKDDGDWKLGKKPIWKGGTIVQKVKNSGVLSEINKVKWHKDGSYVKLKDSCVKFNNQPWCSAGDADKPLKLSKTTSDNISEVAKKLGISEEDVKKVVINQLTR
jgi:hypothetical protein